MQRDDTFLPATADQLAYCLYRSDARHALSPAAVHDIVEASCRRNAARELTGCLHYENGVFFQWLEGPWRQVFSLLDVLHDDPRHLNVTVLDQGTLEHRLFGNWQMRYSDPEAASLIDWLADWANRPHADHREYATRVNAFLTSVATSS